VIEVVPDSLDALLFLRARDEILELLLALFFLEQVAWREDSLEGSLFIEPQGRETFHFPSFKNYVV